MARKIVHLLPVKPKEWDPQGVFGAGSRADFQEIRDRLRADLAVLGVVVSDIGTWASGNDVGMLFECHDAAKNTSMYVCGAYTTSGYPPDVDDIFGGSYDNAKTRIARINYNFEQTSYYGSGLVFGANPDTTVARVVLDFDDATALTYTGGDFTALTTVDPSTLLGLEALFPAHCTYAMETSVEERYHVAHCLGYDSDSAVWMYCQSDTSDSLRFVMWGPILDPSADTNEYGTLHIAGDPTTGNDGRGISHSRAQVHAFDPTGVARVYAINPAWDLDINNYKVSGGTEDGRLNWKKVEVSDGSGGSGIKGHIKEEFMVEIGIRNDGRFRLRPIAFPDEDHPVICYTDACAIWWEKGARMFPTYYTPL